MPVIDWFWKAVYDVLKYLAIVGAGALVTFLATKGKTWVQPIILGLLTSASLAMLYASYVVIQATRRQEQPTAVVTPENLEASIFGWAHKLGVAVRRLPPAESSHFNLEIVLQNRSAIIVGRPKFGDGYLVAQASVRVSADGGGDMGAALQALPPDRQAAIISAIRTEVVRAGDQFRDLSVPLRDYTVQSKIPITGSMSADDFLRLLERVDAGLWMSREVLLRELKWPTLATQR